MNLLPLIKFKKYFVYCWQSKHFEFIWTMIVNYMYIIANLTATFNMYMSPWPLAVNSNAAVVAMDGQCQ